MDILIQHNKENSGGRFFINKDNKDVAEMTWFTSKDGKMVINHTEVMDELKGQGIGKKLVLSGIDFARENSLKIIPVCSYAKHFIERNPEYQDVL